MSKIADIIYTNRINQYWISKNYIDNQIKVRLRTSKVTQELILKGQMKPDYEGVALILPTLVREMRSPKETGLKCCLPEVNLWDMSHQT
jgi:hypothetical protein